MATRKDRIRNLLSRLPMFDELAGRELDDIARAVGELSVPKGGMVFHRGDPCTGFHCIVYGRVKLALGTEQGGEKVVRIAAAGDSFGEALMFMGKPYIVAAQALADSLLLHVPSSVIFAELERDPGFARKMLAGLSRRLHGLVSDVEAYSLHSGTQRVIGYLLKSDEVENSHQIRLDVSKAVVASRLNLTPEHLSRILRDLCVEGLIQVQGRQITLLDIPRLSSYR